MKSPKPARKRSHREPTRTGKVARLPFEIREELNRRILDGHALVSLVDWLNSLPAVQERMREYFGGSGITKDNMTGWVNGGYQEFLRRARNTTAANS